MSPLDECVVCLEPGREKEKTIAAGVRRQVCISISRCTIGGMTDQATPLTPAEFMHFPRAGVLNAPSGTWFCSEVGSLSALRPFHTRQFKLPLHWEGAALRVLSHRTRPITRTE